MKVVRSVLKKSLMNSIKEDNRQFAHFPPFLKTRNYIKTRRDELLSKVKVSYDIAGFDFKDIYYFDPNFEIKDMIHLITVDTMLFDFKEFIHTERPEVTVRESLVKNLAVLTVFGLRNYFSSLSNSRGITLTPEHFILKREWIDENSFPIKTIAPMRYLLVRLDQCKKNEYTKFDRSFQEQFAKQEEKYIEELRKQVPKFMMDWASFVAPDRISGKIITGSPDKTVDLHIDQFFGKDSDVVETIQKNPKMLLDFVNRVIETHQVPMTPVTHIYIMSLFEKWAKCSADDGLQRYQDLVQLSSKQNISLIKEYVEMVVLKELLKLKRVDLT